MREGGLRRLNQLALKTPPQSSNVRFFVALALARLAKQPDVRIPMMDTNVNSDANTSTVRALVQIAQPPPVNPSRASRQAIEALALLCLEDELHQALLVAALPDANVAGGVRPAVLEALLWQAAEKQPADFKRGALLALRRILGSATQNTRMIQVLNQQLNFVWEVATGVVAANNASGEAKTDASHRLSGIMSMLLVIKDEGILDELIQLAGAQAWHVALQSANVPTTVPTIYNDDAPPELDRTVSQVARRPITCHDMRPITCRHASLPPCAARLCSLALDLFASIISLLHLYISLPLHA